MKERILWIDSLKGFLIFLVVWGHCIQFNNINYDNNIIFRIIYSFHMPLFFAVSGYCAFSSCWNINVIYKRARQLLLPFFFWIIVGLIITPPQSIENAFKIIEKKIINPELALWFLWVLFFVNMLTLLIRKVSLILKYKYDFISIIFTIILLLSSTITDIHIFDIKLICWYFGFYSVGAFLKEHDNSISKIFNTKFYLAILFISFITLSSMWMRKAPPLFYHLINLGNIFIYFYKYMTALTGILFFFLFFYTYNKNPIIKNIFWESLGLTTLGIYAIHFLLIHIVKISTIINGNLRWFIYAIIVLLLSFFVVKIIRHSKILKLLSLGEL